MSQKSNNQVTHCYKLQLSYLGQSRYPHFKGRETETGKLTHLPEATHGFKTRSRTGTEFRPSSLLKILKRTLENPSLKQKCKINFIFHQLCILVRIHTLFLRSHFVFKKEDLSSLKKKTKRGNTFQLHWAVSFGNKYLISDSKQ